MTPKHAPPPSVDLAGGVRGLHAAIETGRSASAADGHAATVYVAGWCFHESRHVRDVEVLVDGQPQPVLASRMPRFDVSERFAGSGIKPSLAYRSGFWAIVEAGSGGASRAALSIRASIGQQSVDADLGFIEIHRSDLGRTPDSARSRTLVDQALVVICMATYEPTFGDFQRQVESIRAQTHQNWLCLINDDASSERAVEMMRAVLGDDKRFALERNDARKGIYYNFEACLRRVPRGAAFVSLSDQDDYWHGDKLESLVRVLQDESAILVYSDMRIVDAAGTRIRDTFWWKRSNNWKDLARLLCGNTVTGAASLFSTRLLDVALPFPRHVAGAYHDHWLASVALSMGDLAYVDRPLYDYVQHASNALGYWGGVGAGNSGRRSVEDGYFVDLITAATFGREIMERLGGTLAGNRWRALERAASLDSTRGRAWLWARSMRNLGRGRLGSETRLLVSSSWRWSLAHTPLPPRRLVTVTRSSMPNPPATLVDR